jgi:hypothetical protein
VHALEAIRDLPREDFVRNIPPMLLDAGDKVHGTVAQLVDQLRRFVDDQAHLENRRILDLIHEIESHAIALKATTPATAEFARLDGFAPEMNLAMCRALYKPPRRPVLDLTTIEKGEAELDLGALFKQTSVDEKLLRSHVNELLKFRPQVTLAEVANAFPPQQGLAEIVTYLRIASHEGAAVDETIKDTIVIPGAGPASPLIRDGRPDKHVRVPRVIFTR